MANSTTQSAAYGYTTAAKVWRVRSPNGEQAWYIGATPGECVDDFCSRMGPPQAAPFVTEEISVVMVAATDVITSDSGAGASSGISATAAAWATTYNTAVAAGLSGTNSSQGTQRLLTRTS